MPTKSEEKVTQDQPPSGYPTRKPPVAETKRGCPCPKSKKKGDRGFIEGCLFAICCCWLCEMCF